jgi:thymidylate synthase ThyX
MGEGLGYRYWRCAELGSEYETSMDCLFDAYSSALPKVMGWAEERFPRAPDQPEAAHRGSIKAKALDLLRGLLPAASLSHVGIFATGQTYEQLLLRLFASPLPEARDYARMILGELKAVMPSFVARVDRPDRGGEWIGYLEERAESAARWATRLGLDRSHGVETSGPAVRLLSAHGSEEELLAALVFEAASCSEDEARAALRNLPPDERGAMLAELIGERRNRRHRPGRGFESLRYRFEVVSDYGAFRDLQRHRMLTIQWQTLGPELGAGVPEELEQAGVADSYRAGLERSRAEHERIVALGRPELAPYTLCLGFRIRYILDLNAREAMHMIELRSGREGHPAYRAVAHALHAEIERVHPSVAAAMTFVDRDTEPRLERILSEIRAHAKQTART